MADEQRRVVGSCLRDIEKARYHGNENDMKIVLGEIFDIKDVDLYSLVLAICRESSGNFLNQEQSVVALILDEFKGWLEKHGHLPVAKHHKDEAMFYLVTSGIALTDQLKYIFQLDKGNDREYLVEHLKYLYDSKNDPKTAANIAVKLGLQEFIDPEELLLPLITADKFQVAEELLKSSPKLQNRYAEMLNKLCAMKEDEVFDYIQNVKRLRIVDKTKFKAKTLQKISEKVVKKYELESAKFPNVYRDKNLRSVRHVLGNRYNSHSREHAKWDGNLEAAVASDIWLQEKLILTIAYEYRDIPNAAYWARRLNFPKESLPMSVRKELEVNPTSSFQSNTRGFSSMTDFDDDDGDGDDYGDEFDDCCDRLMLASDETVYDKVSEASNTVNVSKLADQYWKYPLQPENIKFVNLFNDLQSCIKIVFKPGNLIGFDSEWQPKYGRAGQKDKIAILQLAVDEQVFIVDVLEFDKTEEGQKLLKELFRKLFTSENTLRIGFGIESDIKVIVENYPYAQQFLDDAQHFDDLQNISKQLMRLNCVKKKLNIESMMQGSEKGLSFLVKQCFGKPLDKTYQVSNWEQRPLSEQQIYYAALDAFCLVKIYDLFEELAEEFQIIVSTNGTSVCCKDSTGSYHRAVERISETSVLGCLRMFDKDCVVSGPPRRPGQFKVVCDTMLQGLGKNLRYCGVDTVILQNGDEHMKAVELYYQENRVVLTKGKPFYQIRGCVPEDMCMSISDGSAEDQLSAIFQRYNIRVTSKDVFSRCQMCNCDRFIQIKNEHMMLAFWTKNGMRPREDFMSKHKLHHLRGSAMNDTGIDFRHITLSSGAPLKCEFIPLPVFDKVAVFFVCSQCGKVYWEGSHFDKVSDQFSNLIVDSEEDSQ